LKNDERNKKTGNKKEDGNGKAPQKTQFSKKDRKIKKDEKATERISKDKKNLSRTLETVQKSTASMGNFDKKLKNEKELNILKKKKVDPNVMLSRKHERDRNIGILSGVLGKKSSK